MSGVVAWLPGGGAAVERLSGGLEGGVGGGDGRGLDGVDRFLGSRLDGVCCGINGIHRAVPTGVGWHCGGRSGEGGGRGGVDGVGDDDAHFDFVC